MLIVIVAFVVGLRLWLPFINDVQTAVRFEVRLAGQNPFPGLKEAKAGGGGRSVDLHNEVTAANSDIARAKVIPQPGGSQYSLHLILPAPGKLMQPRKSRCRDEKPVSSTKAGITNAGQISLASAVEI